MGSISCDDNLFTVMVRVRMPPEDQQPFLELSYRTIGIFSKFPGFISCHQHRSHDGTEVLSYIQWQNLAAHEACQASPLWQTEGAEMIQYITSGRAEVDVQSYEVVASLEERKDADDAPSEESTDERKETPKA
ncbi:Tetracenomycin-F1 monooxygenase [Planctomycetes bacterium Pan216]|uniref:Tetracenomycin-F1 monooxygenase n=1 Tax=Kolteria novifilia TaxID=2527975 RepID=A0A518B8A8_9BACT|nr:Tetracenomycin-F1 monooxygenase [Planctomycetes bacterium Pan216]